MTECDAILDYFITTIEETFKHACVGAIDNGDSHLIKLKFGRNWIKVQKRFDVWVIISCGHTGRFVITDMHWAALKIEDHDSVIHSFTKACEISRFYDESYRDTVRHGYSSD